MKKCKPFTMKHPDHVNMDVGIFDQVWHKTIPMRIMIEVGMFDIDRVDTLSAQHVAGLNKLKRTLYSHTLCPIEDSIISLFVQNTRQQVTHRSTTSTLFINMGRL